MKEKLKYEKVKMPKEGYFKFVLIKAEEGLKLRGAYEEYHRDIVRKARCEEGLEGLILGGGRIEVNSNTKEIRAYGHSVDYGKAPQDLVNKLLEEYGQKEGFKINVEMGKGY